VVFQVPGSPEGLVVPRAKEGVAMLVLWLYCVGIVVSVLVYTRINWTERKQMRLQRPYGATFVQWSESSVPPPVQRLDLAAVSPSTALVGDEFTGLPAHVAAEPVLMTPERVLESTDSAGPLTREPLLFYPDLLQVDVKGEVADVKVTTTRFDGDAAEHIGRQLADMVGRMGLRKLHLDLDRVQFLADVGLGKFVALHKKVQAVGGKLLLYNVRPEVYPVFEVTYLTRLLDVRPREPGEATARSASA